MPITDLYLKKLLDHLFGKAALTAPTLYAFLSTTVPTAAGGNITEPAGGSYARVTTAASDWNVAVVGSLVTLSNSAQLDFPTPTGSWGTAVAGGLADDVSAGDAVLYGKLTTAKQIDSGTPVNWPTAKFVVELGGAFESLNEVA